MRLLLRWGNNVKDNFDQSFALVLRTEGGFQNDPHDPGNKLPDGRMGCTNMGVTQATWEAYVGHPVTQEDIKALGSTDVAPLYKANYWDHCHCDDLPYGLDYAMYDFCVQSGPGRAIKYLQEILGLTADGAFGPITLAAVRAADERDLTRKLCDKRLAFLRGLEIWSRYGDGLGNRISSVERASLNMVG